MQSHGPSAPRDAGCNAGGNLYHELRQGKLMLMPSFTSGFQKMLKWLMARCQVFPLLPALASTSWRSVSYLTASRTCKRSHCTAESGSWTVARTWYMEAHGKRHNTCIAFADFVPMQCLMAQ